jgi:hypothetical protein
LPSLRPFQWQMGESMVKYAKKVVMGLGIIGWTKIQQKKLSPNSICKLYNVHNVDTWWWQHDIYPFLAFFFHMWFVHCRG